MTKKPQVENPTSEPHVSSGAEAGSQEHAPATPAEVFQPKMEFEIAGVQFQNPVWTASGTFGYGKEFSHLINLNQLGAICVKGISPEPMEGNPPPRIYETDSGMLNAIGLQNVGAKRFLGEKMPFLRTIKARTVVNVFAYSTEDYVRCIEILNEGEGIEHSLWRHRLWKRPAPDGRGCGCGKKGGALPAIC